MENLLEKSESNCELEPHVNEICFNSFDEEMRFLEECIGIYAVVKDSINKGNISIGRETIMSHMKVPVIVKDMKKLACMNDQEKTVEQTFGIVTLM